MTNRQKTLWNTFWVIVNHKKTACKLVVIKILAFPCNLCKSWKKKHSFWSYKSSLIPVQKSMLKFGPKSTTRIRKYLGTKTLVCRAKTARYVFHQISPHERITFFSKTTDNCNTERKKNHRVSELCDNDGDRCSDWLRACGARTSQQRARARAGNWKLLVLWRAVVCRRRQRH